MADYKADIKDIVALRAQTSAGISDCRWALEETRGDMEKAAALIRKKGMEKADKKSERQVKAGMVFSYVHHTGRLGAIVGLACETDFVAKNEKFQQLGREIAMQVAATQPENVDELLGQEYIRDSSKKISDLIRETIGVLGENMQLVDFKIVKV